MHGATIKMLVDILIAWPVGRRQLGRRRSKWANRETAYWLDSFVLDYVGMAPLAVTEKKTN